MHSREALLVFQAAAKARARTLASLFELFSFVRRAGHEQRRQRR
jgi:hypothetical protein